MKGIDDEINISKCLILFPGFPNFFSNFSLPTYFIFSPKTFAASREVDEARCTAKISCMNLPSEILPSKTVASANFDYVFTP